MMNTATPATLPEIIQHSADEHSERLSLCAIGGREYTYFHLAQLVERCACQLETAGIQRGDRVAILSENLPEWGIAFFAIQTMGAVAVPILPDFLPTDIQNILNHSESAAVFVSSRYAPKLSGSETPLLRLTIPIESVSNEHQDAPQLPARIDRDLSWMDASSLAAIVYTSGTSGFSKGVMLSHHNLISDARMTIEMVGATKEYRFLSILPLAHSYEGTLGLILPLMLGASVYYLDRPPSAGVLLPAMARVKPTAILSVPLIIEKLYKAKIQPLLARPILQPMQKFALTRTLLARFIGRRLEQAFGGNLRIFCIGGAALAQDVEDFLHLSGFPYAIGYGLTETAPLSAGDGPKQTRLHATGRPLPGLQIRIANPHPQTGEGEIEIHGPNVMMGYYRDPEKTREAFTEDGWFKTGDLGLIDRDGYLYIKGRLKSLILGPSGKNIYPEEIESALNEFELVVESVVFQQQNKLIARAHLNYEELKRRFSQHNMPDHQTREHIATILEDIRKQVNEKLAHFSRLHRIIEHPEPFEKTPTQKIKRHLYQK